MNTTEMATKIDSQTLLPLSLVSSLIVALIGGILWLSNVYATANTTMEKVKTMEARQDKSKDALDRIDRRLSRIEGKLNIQVESKEDL